MRWLRRLLGLTPVWPDVEVSMDHPDSRWPWSAATVVNGHIVCAIGASRAEALDDIAARAGGRSQLEVVRMPTEPRPPSQLN